MKLAKLSMIILIISVLLLAGCGAKKECSTKDDCTPATECQVASCVKGMCQYTLKAGCICGNGKCDTGENSCTCPADCGACEETIGTIMQKKCINNECITETIGQKESSAEDTIKYIESFQTKVQFSLKAAFDSPFNTKTSLMKVTLKLESADTDVSDIRITKLKIVEHTGTKDIYDNWVDDNPAVHAERDYSKSMLDKTTLFEKEFPIVIKGLDPRSSADKKISLIISYEFKSPDRMGNPVTTKATYEKEIDMSFISPDMAVSCTASCDDSNPCTRDSCSETTDFFCEHDINAGGICCGDDVCSIGEDKCKCPQDCGQCAGDIGTYMAMGCSAENRCAYKIKNMNLIQATRKVAEIDFGGALIRLNIAYDYPFNKADSQLSLTFDPISFIRARNLMISKITILDSTNTFLGDMTLNALITEGSSQTFSTPLSYNTLNAEEKREIYLIFDYSIEQQSMTEEWYPYTATYSHSLGELTILNPN
jgi:hypothetical protein